MKLSRRCLFRSDANVRDGAAIPVRGVIFDLFHTLTGLESEWSDLPSTAKVLGLDRRAWDEALTVCSRWRLIGEIRDPFEILRRLAHQIDSSIPDDLIRRAVGIRVERFRHALARIPPMNTDALKALRRAGLRLGLISNADAMEIATWPGSPLAGLFDTEIFSCDVGLAKPDTEIYRRCLEVMALPASDCMFVGDGGSNELVGAKEVGLTTVFISGLIQELWPERIAARRAVADYHITHLPEILDLVSIRTGARR